MCFPSTVSAKFVFDADLHVFDSPTKDTEQFIEGVTLCFDCFGKMIVEPPFYKLYPNRLFRDFRKAIMVSPSSLVGNSNYALNVIPCVQSDVDYN